MWTDVSEERITPIFRVDNLPSKKPASSRWLGSCRLASCSADCLSRIRSGSHMDYTALYHGIWQHSHLISWAFILRLFPIYVFQSVSLLLKRVRLVCASFQYPMTMPGEDYKSWSSSMSTFPQLPVTWLHLRQVICTEHRVLSTLGLYSFFMVTGDSIQPNFISVISFRNSWCRQSSWRYSVKSQAIPVTGFGGL
jgi:hypothetical protein